MRRTASTLLWISALTTLLGCQELEEPTTVLTQQQWREVEKHILKEEPTPKYKIGANFEDKLELIGFDVTALEPGKKATFTWYWRAKKDLKQNWKVFVHFDTKTFRQNLDHHPVQELYQTSRWKKGQIIRDIQEVTIQANYPPGIARPHIGLFRGKTRLKITNDVKKTSDHRVVGPELTIKGDPKKKAAAPASKPRYAVRQVDAAIKLDGKLDDEVWKKLGTMQLRPFSRGTYKTWAKMFRTKDALYIGAHLQDEHIWGDLKKRDANTWTQEVLEVFLDVNGDAKDYLELQITPNNVVFDANFKDRLGRGKGSRTEQIDRARAWNMAGLETAVHIDGTVNDKASKDKLWTVEIKLPFTSIPGMSGPPKPNAAWALNLYRFDRPEDKQTHAYAWSTAPRGDFHQVDKFGEIRFVPDIKSVPGPSKGMRMAAPKGIKRLPPRVPKAPLEKAKAPAKSPK